MRGKIVDRIRHIFWDTPYEDALSQDENLESGLQLVMRHMHTWITDVIHSCSQMDGPPTGQSSKETLWRALVCDGAPYTKTAPAHYEDAFNAWVEFLREFPSAKEDVERLMEKDEISGLDNDEEMRVEQLMSHLEHLEQRRQAFLVYEGNLGMVCKGRRLCFTENGYIAWVSHDVKEGDEVVFIYGSRVPFILRSPDADRDFETNATEDPLKPVRRLLGDCYVQGLMNGEPIKMQDIPECMIALV